MMLFRTALVASIAATMLGAACKMSNPAFGGAGDTQATSGEQGTAAETATGDGETATSSGSSTSAPLCGDGVIEGEEACDDGQRNGTGGSCKDDCTWNYCGDGYLGPKEGCDDGNTVAGDGCHECVLESCGNGVLDEGEVCEPQLDANCTPRCTENVCGDGYVLGDEACDEGEDNSKTGSCLPDCTSASCGDGYVQDGVEACDGQNVGETTCSDFGYESGTVSCSDSCTLSDENCYTCGDGSITGPEECDGENHGGATCSSLNYGTGSLSCSSCEIDARGCSDYCVPSGGSCQEGSDCCSGLECTDTKCQ